VLFRETVTPRPESVFSSNRYRPAAGSPQSGAELAEAFENPIGTLYGAFTYDFLDDGALDRAWYRGIASSVRKPSPGMTEPAAMATRRPGRGWEAGEYELRMFLGET
jgi:hypothetical protein